MLVMQISFTSYGFPPLVEQVSHSPIRVLFITTKVYVPILDPQGYHSMLILRVVHRYYNWVELLFGFLLWELAWCLWYHETLSSGRRRLGQFQLMDLWTLFLKFKVSSAIGTYHSSQGGNQGKQKQAACFLFFSPEKTWLTTKEEFSCTVLGFYQIWSQTLGGSILLANKMCSLKWCIFIHIMMCIILFFKSKLLTVYFFIAFSDILIAFYLTSCCCIYFIPTL